MLAWPDSCRAKVFASPSMDWFRNQSTYVLFMPSNSREGRAAKN